MHGGSVDKLTRTETTNTTGSHLLCVKPRTKTYLLGGNLKPSKPLPLAMLRVRPQKFRMYVLHTLDGQRPSEIIRNEGGIQEREGRSKSSRSRSRKLSSFFRRRALRSGTGRQRRSNRRGTWDADSRQVERLEGEIAGVEARLKETYDRARTAIDERIRQSGRFLEGAAWCLRPDATALVVIGNSILQGVPIPTDRFLAKIAESRSFEVAGIHVPRNARIGNSIINSSVRAGKTNGRTLYEAIVELRRAGLPSLGQWVGVYGSTGSKLTQPSGSEDSVHRTRESWGERVRGVG